ncbi:beta-phosphoglucomutase [Paenibacillus sp. Marseille-Q4541]|uniref:beta-phosphoglucomutase n=1 Tax=Paenibacillus sp. Marseille-Q4541 TaxID=2831522 RepID=UPI001BA96326|nr:beta-phosphoglucomutase [Paenibacillus sp. Marseille-Q4541]
MRAVLFDLDGVVADTAKYHFIAWRQLGEKIGIVIDEQFNEQLKGVSRNESLERMLKYGNKSNELTQIEKEQLAEEKNQIYVQHIQSITPEDALPQIPELLEELKENGIKIGLASASKNGPLLLNLLGLAHFFDCVVDPSTVPGKPAPDIFIKGSQLLGVDPKQCVGIEDAFSGVEAIKKAGMTAIGIGKTGDLSQADQVYSSTLGLNYSAIRQVWLESH